MITLKHLLGAALVLVSLSPARAGADPIATRVLTFDTLAGSTSVPDGYGGLSWDNFNVIRPDANPQLAGTGYEHGLVSLPNVAFNAFGSPAQVLSGSAFDFFGAFLTGAWNDGLGVTIEGYRGSALRYTSTVSIDTTRPTFVDLNYLGVDSLTFTSFGGTNAGFNGAGTQFAMDDFTYRAGAPAVTPEPASVVLVATALAGLAAKRARRRDRRQAATRNTAARSGQW
jgi:hypothetical protein